ncbi:methyl-accepting chemotaxis protein [Roseomonas sp. AR75]|uniref:methyl-accepting chemotaxis protein n=1 Tax=Roseomonas sp. AR75 TaxID=2562311 RepID=UPI0010C089F8|nr:methyl-accepting chemotaxis protein [Roseomonas sp. AR75]
MIADAELNITYVNASAMALMRESEAELKRELPRFDTKTLLGSNIDIFHKNPKHQRGMLAALDKPHAATIRVGSRVFDLLVTPLQDKGARIGFVVEWSDARHRLLNLDYAAQLRAIHRNMAVIEFATDGTILSANQNFLDAMGYALPEIQGRHHSMFMEPGGAETPEYIALWNELRAGHFRAARFKRVARGGRVAWLEGAYNPILDESGKVTKVVKFATDVTEKIDMQARLKGLIDDMTRGIGESTSSAGAVAQAANATLANVREVAASSNQLAGSIDEIARTMATSRTVSAAALDQAVGVGGSADRLAEAAKSMSGIVDVIRTIASQINLLALNATIEAARAGQAGKGFAVVASEVKSLAVQAAKATDQIAGEIDRIQATSLDVAGAVAAIRTSINTMTENVAVTAASVEEQSAVTRGMSGNVQDAAESMARVDASLAEITGALRRVTEAVDATQQASEVLMR